MKKQLFILILCAIYILLSINSALKGGDFDVYLDAAIKISNYQNIYTPPFIKQIQYYYSPLFALILVPFTSHFFIISFLWLLLSGFFLYRIARLVINYFDISILTKKEQIWLFVISSFFILRFLHYNIAMIQITIFLLWAILECIRLINNKKWIIGSMLLAFAINIKLMPLVALPYLIYRQKFKASLSVFVFSVFYLFVPSIFIGYEFNNYLLQEWWKIINPMNSEHLIEANTNAQSFVGLIPIFLTETQGEIELSRNILFLSIPLTEQITNMIRLLFIVFTLFFLQSPFKVQSKISEIRAIAYICLLVPLIFPHQNKYAFIFLYPMIIYLTYYCLIMWKYNRTKRFNVYLFLLLFVSIIFSPFIGSDVIGRYPYDLLHHYRLLGIGTTLLIVFAVIGSPKKINRAITANTFEK